MAERFCTGDASDWEKFQKWAETVPKTLRNPLYHWTHLELKRPFGIRDRLLVAGHRGRHLGRVQRPAGRATTSPAAGIMRQMNVALVCTTDDPADTLEHHARLRPTRRFRSTCCPPSARTRPWPSTRRRRSTPGWTAWRRSADVDIGSYAALPARRSAAAARFLPRAAAAAFRTTGWRRSMRTTYARRQTRRPFSARPAAARSSDDRRGGPLQVGHALRVGRDGP